MLTAREREVLELVLGGYTSKRIAGRLELSERGVNFHRGNIRRKLAGRDLSAIVRLIEPEEDNDDADARNSGR